MKITNISLITVAIMAFTLSMNATPFSFNFYQLDRDGIADDFLPENAFWEGGVGNSDGVSSDVFNGSFGGSLTYISGGVTAVVSALGDSVVQDSVSNWSDTNAAGLGVYSANPLNRSDDNITFGETLLINFNREVTLTNMWLTDDGHRPFVDDGISQFNLNGNAMFIGDGYLNGSWTGTSFKIGFTKDTGDQFYIASLGGVTNSVPDHGNTLGLMGITLLGLGFAGRKFSV